MITMREYFLGGASPEGFKTSFDKLIYDGNNFTYIIKGTAGSGKSTLMKKLAAAFPEEDKEIFYCSADPASLDAVYLKKRGIIIVDGTAPHVFEPKYPFAYQAITDLGAYLEQGTLYSRRTEIADVTDEYSMWHQRCRRYLSALSSITDDMAQIGRSALYTDKLEGFTERISRKLLPRKQNKESGRTEYRSMSAITPKGYELFLPEDCSIYLLSDELFCGSDKFLRAFEENALRRGYDVTVSCSYLHSSPIYEHMIIPEIKTAFITAGTLLDPKPEVYRPISFKRFYDKNELAAKKLRLKFDKSACRNLMSEAVDCLVSAKTIHDKLESYYISAADFGGINRLVYRLISEIKSKEGK